MVICITKGRKNYGFSKIYVRNNDSDIYIVRSFNVLFRKIL